MDSSPSLSSLSIEVYHFHIFKYLHIHDIWNLKTLNSKLYSVVKSYNIYELSIMTHDYHKHFSYFCKSNEFLILNTFQRLIIIIYFTDKYRDNWTSTSRPINLTNQIHVFANKPPKVPSSNLKHLKYLRMSFADNLFKLEDLKMFPKLQILEIFYMYLYHDRYLELPNLKALFIANFKSKPHAKLFVNSPHLHHLSLLKYEGNEIIDSKIKLSDPLSLKYLKIRFYEHNVTKFENLECFELYYSKEAVRLELGDPIKFKKLKKFKIASVVFSPTINQLRELFVKKKPNLEIVLEGVSIKELSKFDEHSGLRGRIAFQLNNYADLEDNLNFVTTMNYNDLLLKLPDHEPADLFQKFNNVQTLEITSEIKDEDRLINFIKKCPNLYNLKIRKSSLSQKFYNRLPENSSLSYLEIIYKSSFDLNFEFIMKMPWLINFYTNQDIRLNKRLNLNNFKLLKRFEFHIIKDKRQFMITRISDDRYSVPNYQELELPDRKFNLNELIRWSDFIRLKK